MKSSACRPRTFLAAARMCRSTNQPQATLPEVWFRIRHVAVTGGDGPPADESREQTVEVAVGPKGALKHSWAGALRRRIAPRRVVTAGPTRRSRPALPRSPRTPRVAELLRKAITWQELLSSGAAPTQAEISRREGITRARVGQVMEMLRLAPDIQERLLAMPATVGRPPVTERTLQPILHIKDLQRQRREFEGLLKFREIPASRPRHRATSPPTPLCLQVHTSSPGATEVQSVRSR
jgi:hypothetical protein